VNIKFLSSVLGGFGSSRQNSVPIIIPPVRLAYIYIYSVCNNIPKAIPLFYFSFRA